MNICTLNVIYYFPKALGWLNPATVSVKNRLGAKVKAVAIVKSVVDSFADISHAVCIRESSLSSTHPYGKVRPSVTERRAKIQKRKLCYLSSRHTYFSAYIQNGCFSIVITRIHLRSASVRSLARIILL